MIRTMLTKIHLTFLWRWFTFSLVLISVPYLYQLQHYEMKVKLQELRTHLNDFFSHSLSGKSGPKFNHPHCKFLLFSFKAEFPLLQQWQLPLLLLLYTSEKSLAPSSLSPSCVQVGEGDNWIPLTFSSPGWKTQLPEPPFMHQAPNHLSALLVDLLQFINLSFAWGCSKQDMVPQMWLHRFQAEGCKHFPT